MICQNSSPRPGPLGWPHMAWLSFTELDKAVVHVIRLVSFLWLLFQSVYPLMPSLSAYCLIHFRLPWTWGISSWLLQQSTAAAPYLECGVSLTLDMGYLLSLLTASALRSHHSWLPRPFLSLLPGKPHGQRLQSMRLQRVRQDWATSLSLFTFMHWRRKCQPTPAFLPGESQGQRSLVGCRLWGCTESDTTEMT